MDRRSRRRRKTISYCLNYFIKMSIGQKQKLLGIIVQSQRTIQKQIIHTMMHNLSVSDRNFSWVNNSIFCRGIHPPITPVFNPVLNLAVTPEFHHRPQRGQIQSRCPLTAINPSGHRSGDKGSFRQTLHCIQAQNQVCSS